ncbi:MAG TPA: tetratricopeptide repeat protein, partial [Kamptonema sp.]|nr:tetratricopeptide repeat protein [Kamptonema sp.]
MLSQSRLVLVSLLSTIALYWGPPITGAWPVVKVVEVTAQASGNEAAQKALTEGLQLYKQGTAESLRKAIAKFEEALKLYQEAGDRGGEAVTLSSIGTVHSDLGEQQKALEYYNQSLSLFRAVGDRGGEAVTLSSIGTVHSDLGEKQKALEYYNQSLPLI